MPAVLAKGRHLRGRHLAPLNLQAALRGSREAVEIRGISRAEKALSGDMQANGLNHRLDDERRKAVGADGFVTPIFGEEVAVVGVLVGEEVADVVQ